MSKWTRRSFITAGLVSCGALVVGVAIRPGNRVSKLKGLVASTDENLVNAWVKINPNNRITVIVPHCEMGQGVHTSLPMMLAEEMDVDWSMVDVMEAPDDLEYANYALARGFIMGDVNVPEALVQTVNGGFLKITQMLKLQITGGSTSIRNTGVHAMRMAGASAKDMLIEAAANVWKVNVNEITTKSNYLYHKASQQQAPYSEFAEIASKMTPPSAPKLKQVKDYQLVGTSPDRVDLVPKINGEAKFGIDKELPNLVFAAVKRSPVFGETLMSVDSKEALLMKDVLQVVQLDNAVAVIAKGYWQAEQALARLKIQWSESSNSLVSTKSLFKQFKQDMKTAIENGDEKIDFEKGDAQQALLTANKIVEAEYSQPYLAHTPMEPLNCTVQIKEGFCELWTGSQNPLGFRSEVAEALGFELDNVKVHNHFLGGGFGRRAIADYAVQAALIVAQISGNNNLSSEKLSSGKLPSKKLSSETPVKVIWSREEDIKQDWYRQACVSQFKAGLNEQGFPIAWLNQYVDKHEPEEAPHIPYKVENQFIHYADSPTHIPFGPWRSVDHSLHAFFTESFIDECAHTAKQDPYQYRQQLLTDSPRLLKALNTVAEKANWNESAINHDSSLQVGKGIAIHQSFNTIVAQVAEVEVINNKIQVTKVTCVVDAGFAINPDGLVAQMEGGIIFGLTAALYGEINIEKGQVKENNFDDYPMIRMDASPVIEVHIINSGSSLGGGGEPGTPPIMAAVANAVFAATGKRFRDLPLQSI